MRYLPKRSIYFIYHSEELKLMRANNKKELEAAVRKPIKDKSSSIAKSLKMNIDKVSINYCLLHLLHSFSS